MEKRMTALERLLRAIYGEKVGAELARRLLRQVEEEAKAKKAR